MNKNFSLVFLLLLLNGCAYSHITKDYYDSYGDKCHEKTTINVFLNTEEKKVSCNKGERTGNLNLNVNKPQHDPQSNQ
jgi:uncharacterized protein (UPF0261 family)